jgi:hypothetical protein
VKGSGGSANASEYRTKGKSEPFHGFGAHKLTTGLGRMGREETERTAAEDAEKREQGEGVNREKKKAGLVNARRRNAGCAQLGRSVLRPYKGKPATRISRS